MSDLLVHLLGLGSLAIPLPGAADLTVSAAAAPAITRRLTLWALGLGALVLGPSLVYLFQVFKRGPAEASFLSR